MAAAHGAVRDARDKSRIAPRRQTRRSAVTGADPAWRTGEPAFGAGARHRQRSTPGHRAAKAMAGASACPPKVPYPNRHVMPGSNGSRSRGRQRTAPEPRFAPPGDDGGSARSGGRAVPVRSQRWKTWTLHAILTAPGDSPGPMPLLRPSPAGAPFGDSGVSASGRVAATVGMEALTCVRAANIVVRL